MKKIKPVQIVLIFVLILMLVVISMSVYKFFRTASTGEIIGWTIFWAVIIIFILLAVKFPALKRWFESANIALMRFTAWYFIFFIPLFPYIYFERLYQFPSWLQVLIFIAWGALLIFAIWAIVFERNRIKLFNGLRKIVGRFAPLVYSIDLILIGIYFFSALTFVLVQRGILYWVEPTGQNVTLARISDFYFWHFLDAMPIFKITDTLLLKEPLVYDDSGIGFLLLLFKIIVISPIIGAFIWYWRYIGQEKKEEKTKKPIPKRVPRTYHRKSRALR